MQGRRDDSHNHPFRAPARPVERILRACTVGLAGDTLVMIEDETKKALRKTMGQAFLGGFCAGYREHDFTHTCCRGLPDHCNNPCLR